MVKKIQKDSKDKYRQRRGNNNKFYIIGIGIALAAAILVFMNMGGASDGRPVLAGPAPSGSNCPENVAYLQVGVDKYKEATGTFPVDLKELTQVKEGQGPFIEKMVECPSGNLYIVENGIVKEAAR